MQVHAIEQNAKAISVSRLVAEIQTLQPDLSKTDIARRIGRSHTTITRKKKGSEGAQVETLNRLIRLRDEILAEKSLSGFAEPEVEEIVADASPPDMRPGRDQLLVRINNRALELAGILPGDLVLIQLGRDPGDGDIALLQVIDQNRAAAESLCRRFVEPDNYAVATMDPAIAQRPLRPGRDFVQVRGTMIRLLREAAG